MHRDAQSSPLFHELDDAAVKGVALLVLGVRGQHALELQHHLVVEVHGVRQVDVKLLGRACWLGSGSGGLMS